MSGNTRKTKRIVVIVLAIIVIGVCGILSIVGVSLIYAYKSNENIPVLSDLVEKGERLIVSEEQFDQMLADAFRNSSNTTTLANRIEGFKGLTSDITLQLNAESDGIPMKLNGKGNLSVNEQSNGVGIDSNLSLDVAGMQLKSDLAIRTFGDETKSEAYLKIKDIPSFFFMVYPQLSEIDNKWIFIDATESDEDQQLQQKKRENFIKLAQTKEFLSLINRAPDKVLNNIRNYCVDFSMSEAQYKTLSNKYMEISGEPLSENIDGVFQLDAKLCAGRVDGKFYLFDLKYSAQNEYVSLKLDNFKYPSTSVEVEKPKADINTNDLELDLSGNTTESI